VEQGLSSTNVDRSQLPADAAQSRCGTAHDEAFDRRALSRALTRVSFATVEEALRGLSQARHSGSRRIGITGPPGAGKSALISELARVRLAKGHTVGVLAIDPTSPVSRGSILGDRVRMGDGHAHERLFFRSMPSRVAHDGLTDNVADLLCTMEQHGLDEIIVETVGVGQVEYTIRSVVDTVLLVAVPGTGDDVQAMKAGILEIADILVVNKSDLAGARKMHSELAAMVAMRPFGPDSWQPPVLLACASAGDLGGLPDAIDAHRDWIARAGDARHGPRSRMRYHVGSLLARRIEEVFGESPESLFDGELGQVYRRVLDLL